MKKQILKDRVSQLLLQIHRGFLTEDQSNGATDQEILTNVPVNKGTYIDQGNDNKEARVSPFTYRWVKQRVKKDPTVTAYALLESAGFK